MKCDDCGVVLSEETTKHFRVLPATRTDPEEPEFWQCECGAIYGWEYEQTILWPEEEEAPILVTLPVIDTKERDKALPVEPATRGRNKLFYTTERGVR